MCMHINCALPNAYPTVCPGFKATGKHNFLLLGTWSPIIHAPPVKPVRVLSMETSHLYLTKTFQSDLSTNLKFSCCCPLLMN